VTLIIELKVKDKLFYKIAAKIIGVSYRRLMHYKSKVKKGCEPLEKRGCKSMCCDGARSEFRMDAWRLDHRNKCTYGVGQLDKQYRGRIPRAERRKIVKEVRHELKQQRLASLNHLEWMKVQVVWSMDIFEYVFNGKKYFVLQVQDMVSRLKFKTVCGQGGLCGAEVAGHLAHLFEEHGAPLFLKMDNGSNLNAADVQDILEYYKVLPLNSPPYYPQYNGAIERAQSEVKEYLTEQIEQENVIHEDAFRLAVHLAVHDANHRKRDVLYGECSCAFYHCHKRVTWTKQERTQVYQEVSGYTLDIADEVGYVNNTLMINNAWRKACQLWLLKNHAVKIIKGEKVLPISSQKS